MFDSLRPHGLQPTRLLSSRHLLSFPGQRRVGAWPLSLCWDGASTCQWRPQAAWVEGAQAMRASSYQDLLARPLPSPTPVYTRLRLGFSWWTPYFTGSVNLVQVSEFFLCLFYITAFPILVCLWLIDPTLWFIFLTWCGSCLHFGQPLLGLCGTPMVHVWVWPGLWHHPGARSGR